MTEDFYEKHISSLQLMTQGKTPVIIGKQVQKTLIYASKHVSRNTIKNINKLGFAVGNNKF